MNKLNELKSIIKSLSVSEYKSICNRLIYYDRISLKKTSFKLFELIYNDQNITYEDLSNELYNKSKDEGLKKLIYRVLEKVLDVLLNKENIEFNEIYDNRARAIFLLERQLIIVEILRYRGMFNLALEKLNQVIEGSKYYEHYILLVNSLEKKRRWINSTINELEDGSLNEQISFYNRVKEMVVDSEEIYVSVSRNNISNVERIMLNKKHIIKINRYYNYSMSKTIQYLLYYLKIENYSLKQKYGSALKLNEELVSFVSSNDCIFTRTRYGTAYLNLGLFQRSCCLFETAISSFNIAHKYLVSQGKNKLILYEQFYITYYYIGEDTKMRYYISLLNEESSKDKIVGITHNKIVYYNALLQFINAEYEKSNTFLQKYEFKKGADLLNIEIKLLQIINYIELGKYDLAENYIDNLRKYIYRIKYKTAVLERYKTVLRLFITMASLSFDFKVMSNKNNKAILNLNYTSRKNNFNGSEMLFFNEWLDSKLKSLPYNHAEAMKRLRKSNRRVHAKVYQES